MKVEQMHLQIETKAIQEEIKTGKTNSFQRKEKQLKTEMRTGLQKMDVNEEQSKMEIETVQEEWSQ